MPAKILIIYSNRHSNFNEALTLKGMPIERLLAKKLAAILVYLPKKYSEFFCPWYANMAAVRSDENALLGHPVQTSNLRFLFITTVYKQKMHRVSHG